MNAPLYNLVFQLQQNDCDTLHVSLIDPTTLAAVESYDAILSDTGSAPCTFSSAVSGHYYYIRLTHRNALETWVRIQFK